jgi:hypothetical protein
MNPASRGRAGVQRIVQWVLLVAAVVLLIVWVRTRPGSRGESAPDAPPPLARGEGASVIGLVFTQPTGRWTLDLEGDRWWIREPVRDLASARMVRELLRALEELEVRRRLETDSLARHGLDPPALTLQLREAGSVVRELRIGAAAPASGDAYAAWTGLRGVAIIPRFIVTRFFSPDLFVWRERELLPPMAQAVDSVWITAGGERVRAQRTAAEQWVFLSPRDREADPLSLERTVAGFWRLNFGGFIDDPAQWGGLGLDPPRATWVVFRGGRADTVRVGARIDPLTIILQTGVRPPGRAPAELYGYLAGGLAALEARTAIAGSATELAHLLLAGPGRARLYARVAGRWRVAEVSPGGAQTRLEAGSLADTVGLAWQDAVDPTLDGDAADLYAAPGETWLRPLSRPPGPSAFPLRIHLWDRAHRHAWVFLEPERGEAPGSRGALGPAARAVGSRFPTKPMRVRLGGLLRWEKRLAPGA